MGAVIPIAAQLVQLGVTVAPSIIEAVNLEMRLSGSGNAPTPAEQAQYDAALDEANAALQAAQPAS